MEGPFLVFYFFALYCGLLLPIPSVILAWREWIKRTRASPGKGWRRTMSQIGLLLCTVGMVLWIYIWVAEGLGKLSPQYYYGSRTMYVGVFGSLATIAVSALAEGKLRKYLFLTAVGLLCFFCFGAGEAI